MATGSTEFVRNLLVAASIKVAPEIAAAARASKSLRADSGKLFAELAKAEFESIENQHTVCTDGLAAFDQGNYELAKSAWATDVVSTASYRGNAQPLPLTDAGLEQLVTLGSAEPGALHLPKPPRSVEGLGTLVALGAFAELSVVREWLAAGGSVAAVARKGPRWSSLQEFAQGSAGELLVPTKFGEGEPGLDIVEDCAEISAWVSQLARTRRLVIGAFFYAPGAKHLAVTSAADAIIRVAAEQLGPEQLSVAFMGTPTDSTVVPAELAEASLAGWRNRSVARKARDAGFGLGGWLKKPTPALFTSKAGAKLALVDSSVAMQGANYLAAKRAQRWRAFELQAAGFRVIYQVLPPANTESVVGFGQLEVAFRGTSQVGIHTIAAGDARNLFAYLLAAQLSEPQQSFDQTHPTSLHERTALHGGLWRLPYAPSSAWVAAWILGRLNLLTKR